MRLRPVDRASQQRTRLSSNLFLRERKTKEDERERKREKKGPKYVCNKEKDTLYVCGYVCVGESEGDMLIE